MVPAFIRTAVLGVAALAVLLSLFIAFAPDPAVAQATRSCPGAAEQVFPSMVACSAKHGPGCVCFREPNVWFKVYWWAVPVVLGSLAAIVLRTRWYVALSCLVGAVGVGGLTSLLALHELGRIDNVELLYSGLAMLQLAILACAVWACVRLLLNRFTVSNDAGAA
jgi:hypothetical protein